MKTRLLCECSNFSSHFIIHLSAVAKPALSFGLQALRSKAISSHVYVVISAEFRSRLHSPLKRISGRPVDIYGLVIRGTDSTNKMLISCSHRHTILGRLGVGSTRVHRVARVRYGSSHE